VQQKTRGDAWNGACTVAGNPNCPAEKGPDLDFGAGTLLGRTSSGADVILGGQKSGTVHALNPDKDGEALWSVRVGRGGIQGGIHFGMAAKEGRLFVPISDTTDTYFGNAYKEPARPGLYALDIATGRTVWSTPADNICAGRENCEPGISAAITALDDVVFAGHLDGRFRAYDANDGKVLWETDTARDYVTVSGATAHGGTLEGPGAIVEDGMVYVNSGYGLYFKMPGNVLLAFAAGAEEKR
jgi:polyvinyl alcohol dehydrogenase (cytochrome)